MGLEIERKFLVTGDRWRAGADAGRRLRQGYLCADPHGTVRVRLAGPAPQAGDGERAWLTVKGPTRGAVRQEFEYAIPPADAADLLALCADLVVEKVRYRVPHAGRVWEVDVFAAANRPLVVAEVELQDAADEVVLPDWVGAEVTEDRRYSNSNLARHPFSRW